MRKLHHDLFNQRFVRDRRAVPPRFSTKATKSSTVMPLPLPAGADGGGPLPAKRRVPDARISGVKKAKVSTLQSKTARLLPEAGGPSSVALSRGLEQKPQTQRSLEVAVKADASQTSSQGDCAQDDGAVPREASPRLNGEHAVSPDAATVDEDERTRAAVKLQALARGRNGRCRRRSKGRRSRSSNRDQQDNADNRRSRGRRRRTRSQDDRSSSEGSGKRQSRRRRRPAAHTPQGEAQFDAADQQVLEELMAGAGSQSTDVPAR